MGRKIMIYAEIIFLHISFESEIQLMSILKLFFDAFVGFIEKGGNYYLTLNENILVLDL